MVSLSEVKETLEKHAQLSVPAIAQRDPPNGFRTVLPGRLTRSVRDALARVWATALRPKRRPFGETVEQVSDALWRGRTSTPLPRH